VQALHDAVDELKARLAKISKQLDDMQTTQQNITTPPAGQPGGSPGGAANNVPQSPLLILNVVADQQAYTFICVHRIAERVGITLMGATA